MRRLLYRLMYTRNAGYRLPQNESSKIAPFGKIGSFQGIDSGNQVTGIFQYVYLYKGVLTLYDPAPFLESCLKQAQECVKFDRYYSCF